MATSSLLRVAPVLALLLVALLAAEQARAEPAQTGSSLGGSVSSLKRKVLEAKVTPSASAAHALDTTQGQEHGRLASTRVLQQVVMPPVVVVVEESSGEESSDAGGEASAEAAEESSLEESSTGLAPWQLGRRMLRGN